MRNFEPLARSGKEDGVVAHNISCAYGLYAYLLAASLAHYALSLVDRYLLKVSAKAIGGHLGYAKGRA